MNCGVRNDQDTGLFVSYCPTLEIYSQAETESEAIDAIKSAITLRMSTALDHGRFDKLLRKAGFTKITANEPAHVVVAADVEFVNVHSTDKFKAIPVEVPLQLLVASAGQSDACTH